MSPRHIQSIKLDREPPFFFPTPLNILHSCPNLPQLGSMSIVQFRFARGVVYLFCICCESCWLCSWKRSLTRCWVAIHLRTQRLTQPLSFDETDLEVKSSTQEVKQCSTRPPKAYWLNRGQLSRFFFFFRDLAPSLYSRGTYAHELLDLALLHALLQLALLGGC